MTGGRLKRVARFVQDEIFCFTYGDGLADINISHLIDFHRSHGKKATLTSIQQPVRHGTVDISDTQQLQSFRENHPAMDHGSMAFFFALEPSAIDRVTEVNYLEANTF